MSLDDKDIPKTIIFHFLFFYLFLFYFLFFSDVSVFFKLNIRTLGWKILTMIHSKSLGRYMLNTYIHLCWMSSNKNWHFMEITTGYTGVMTDFGTFDPLQLEVYLRNCLLQNFAATNFFHFANVSALPLNPKLLDKWCHLILFLSVLYNYALIVCKDYKETSQIWVFSELTHFWDIFFYSPQLEND